MRLPTLTSSIREPIGGIAAPAVSERLRGSSGIKDRRAIWQRDCGLCQACKRSGVVRLGAEVDHIIPLHMGGSEAASNKQLLCKQCHATKTSKEAKSRS